MRFNTGKTKWRYLTPEALTPMIEVLEYGYFKYSVFKSPTDASKRLYGHEIPDVTQWTVKESGWTIVKGKENDWKKGLSVVECSESLMRHLFSFLEGHDIDPESGCKHVGHILANALFISYMVLFNTGWDDRKN